MSLGGNGIAKCPVEVASITNGYFVFVQIEPVLRGEGGKHKRVKIGQQRRGLTCLGNAAGYTRRLQLLQMCCL